MTNPRRALHPTARRILPSCKSRVVLRERVRITGRALHFFRTPAPVSCAMSLRRPIGTGADTKSQRARAGSVFFKKDAAHGVLLREDLVRFCRPAPARFSQWTDKRRATRRLHRARPISRLLWSHCDSYSSVRACSQNACSCASQPPVLPAEIEQLLSSEIQGTTKPDGKPTCNSSSDSPEFR